MDENQMSNEEKEQIMQEIIRDMDEDYRNLNSDVFDENLTEKYNGNLPGYYDDLRKIKDPTEQELQLKEAVHKWAMTHYYDELFNPCDDEMEDDVPFGESDLQIELRNEAKKLSPGWTGKNNSRRNINFEQLSRKACDRIRKNCDDHTFSDRERLALMLLEQGDTIDPEQIAPIQKQRLNISDNIIESKNADEVMNPYYLGFEYFGNNLEAIQLYNGICCYLAKKTLGTRDHHYPAAAIMQDKALFIHPNFYVALFGINRGENSEWEFTNYYTSEKFPFRRSQKKNIFNSINKYLNDFQEDWFSDCLDFTREELEYFVYQDKTIKEDILYSLGTKKEFCPRCGYRLDDKRICPYCGYDKQVFYENLYGLRLSARKLYDSGRTDEAIFYMNLACEAGNCDAILDMATRYEYGIGLKADIYKAHGYYRMAAQNHDVLALNWIGDSYYRGLMINGDERDAIGAYNDAAEQGSIDAKKKIEHIDNTKKWPSCLLFEKRPQSSDQINVDLMEKDAAYALSHGRLEWGVYLLLLACRLENQRAMDLDDHLSYSGGFGLSKLEYGDLKSHVINKDFNYHRKRQNNRKDDIDAHFTDFEENDNLDWAFDPNCAGEWYGRQLGEYYAWNDGWAGRSCETEIVEEPEIVSADEDAAINNLFYGTDPYGELPFSYEDNDEELPPNVGDDEGEISPRYEDDEWELPF